MKRLLIVHLAGDFRAAWALREHQGVEAYYGHSYILDQLGRLAAEHGAAGYLSCLAPPYHETLPNGATVMGAGARPDLYPGKVIACIRAFAPTHLIVHGPMPGILRWGLRQGLPTACLFADSFKMHPVERWLRHRGLTPLLNRPEIAFVGNHGINAARGLVEMGVHADKVIAWDYPHVLTPAAFAPKPGLAAGARLNLLYVGTTHRTKGTGDLIEAVARLAPHRDLHLTIIGEGKSFAAHVARLGITDRITFAGRVPNREIPARMHAADAVVIPSRHAYPEGLPLTLYEALASRTPVIASDHPMFAGHLVDGETGLVFRAGDPDALAAAIARLADDPGLYARVSTGAARAWKGMQLDTKWGDLIGHWLAGAPEDRAWLAARTMPATMAAT